MLFISVLRGYTLPLARDYQCYIREWKYFPVKLVELRSFIYKSRISSQECTSYRNILKKKSWFRCSLNDLEIQRRIVNFSISINKCNFFFYNSVPRIKACQIARLKKNVLSQYSPFTRRNIDIAIYMSPKVPYVFIGFLELILVGTSSWETPHIYMKVEHINVS